MDDETEKVEVRFTADFNWPVPGTCETIACSGMVPKACAEAAIAEGRAASMTVKSAAKKAKSAVSYG